MKIASNGFVVTLLALCISAVVSEVVAGGLSTQLGEAVIENLQVGQSYSLSQLANLRLVVTNNSDYRVDLKMDVLRPDHSELRNGSEPVPDTSWVKLSRDIFVLEPNEKASSDITLSIPDDNQYLGKKYQVTVWSHTLGGNANGMLLAYGLKSRIIFTTDTVRAPADRIVKSSNASVDLALEPEEVFLDDVELGKPYDLEVKKGLVLKVSNRGEQEQVFRLQSLTVRNSVATLTDGYEDAPDASYLRFSESEFVLPPKGTKVVKLYLDFPQRAEYRGKRFMFVVFASSVNEQVRTGVYSRIYALTK